MAKTSDEKTYSSSEVARVLGLTPRRVQQLVKQGTITAETRNGALRFDLAKTVQDYIAAIKAERPPTDEDAERQKLVEEVRYKRAKADQAELELAEVRGNLHRSDDVEAVLADLVYAARSDLMALPGRAAVDAFAAKSAAEVAEILKREIHLIMEDLATYTYDPRRFEARVRSRKGWGEAE